MTPTGKITFLITDIEGSTRLSQEYPDILQSALEKNYAIFNKAIDPKAIEMRRYPTPKGSYVCRGRTLVGVVRS